jgi:hypothetical protein
MASCKNAAACAAAFPAEGYWCAGGVAGAVEVVVVLVPVVVVASVAVGAAVSVVDGVAVASVVVMASVVVVLVSVTATPVSVAGADAAAGSTVGWVSASLRQATLPATMRAMAAKWVSFFIFQISFCVGPA